MKFIKKPVVIEATQWFKNGDHPKDYTKDEVVVMRGKQETISAIYRKLNNWEGDVVRYYRSPTVDGKAACKHCGKTMHEHGWIETLEGGHIVCPGDWIITGIKGERTLRLPGARLEGLDAVAVGAENLAGMSFDLVSSRPNGFGGAEVDHLTVHVVNVEGNGILAVSANDTSACELVRRDPVLHLTDAGSRLGVHLIAIAGVTQTVPAPGCTLGAGGLWSRWSRPALTDSGAEPCVASSCLEPGATLGADEVVSHAGIVIPYLYTCKPDIFAATYDKWCSEEDMAAQHGPEGELVDKLRKEMSEQSRRYEASKNRIKELEDLMPGAAWFIRRCLPVYQPPEGRHLAETMAKMIEDSMRGLTCDPPLPAVMDDRVEGVESNKATIGQLEELVLKATAFSRCDTLPEQHPCEECDIRGLQLYYHRTCHEVDEGEYLCLRCIVKRWADFREECASSGHE